MQCSEWFLVTPVILRLIDWRHELPSRSALPTAPRYVAPSNVFLRKESTRIRPETGDHEIKTSSRRPFPSLLLSRDAARMSTLPSDCRKGIVVVCHGRSLVGIGSCDVRLKIARTYKIKDCRCLSQLCVLSRSQASRVSYMGTRMREKEHSKEIKYIGRMSTYEPRCPARHRSGEEKQKDMQILCQRTRRIHCMD